MNSIVFHARKSKEDKTPLFTVRFAAEQQFGANASTLLCTVSKPHPFLETYSKKTGNKMTQDRMEKLEKEVGTVPTISTSSKTELAKYLPRGVVKMIPFYADRARRFFKLENPRLVVRGTKVSWIKTDDYRNMAEKRTILVSTQLDSISN